MTEIAVFLCSKGYILRSGGASGADSAFETGVPDSSMKEIYLPWKGFNGSVSSRYRVADEAIRFAREFHPAFDRLAYGARRLMARNGYQVLGFDLSTPVDFVICWTKQGKEIGGTAQALKIARSRGIPYFNLFFFAARDKIQSWISNNQITLDT
jgi:hypothetical protein